VSFGPGNMVFTDFSILVFLSEHKHCDNAATNWNSENARSRIMTSLRESVNKGTKYWAYLACWISSCYGPFSHGAHF